MVIIKIKESKKYKIGDSIVVKNGNVGKITDISSSGDMVIEVSEKDDYRGIGEIIFTNVTWSNYSSFPLNKNTNTSIRNTFKLDDKVRIVNIKETDFLYRKTGTVMGKSFVDVNGLHDEYIILLDVPKPDAKCIVMNETCLEKEKI